MKVAIYIRVSTQEQAQEGYSIQAQTERLESFCKAKDWTIVNKYIDPGFSGSNIDRPGMQKLISDAKHNTFNLLLVYKLDRLSRSQKDTLFLIEDVFLKNHVDFVSINENFDTSTAFGRAMIGILSVFAQLEREQIKERTRMGLVARCESGLHHSSAPFGYFIENGMLVINPVESEMVKEMFALFISGESYPAIGKAMKAKYPQFTSYFAYDNAKRISETIHIPTYAGFVKFGETLVKGSHTPIIDEITFQRTQALLESRSEQWKSNRRRYNTIDSPYLLSGMLFCKFCGARYRVVPKSNKHGKRIIYECYSRIGAPKHMVKDCNCKAPIYKMEDLDSLVIAEVNKLLLSETCFHLARDESAANNDIVISTTKELDAINSKINKLLDLYENSDFNSEIVSERLNALEDKRKSLQLFLASRIKSKPSVTHPEFKNKYASFEDISKNGVTAELRQLLRSLIEYIELSEEEIIFHWTF